MSYDRIFQAAVSGPDFNESDISMSNQDNKDEKNILIVDDEYKLREALCTYFTAMGWKVFAAGTGCEALGIFHTAPIDFIILDLMLPGLSGEQVCREIRSFPSDVPIIMLTAKSADEDAVNGLGLGADDYVTKPFSIKQLYARVEAILRRSGSCKVHSSEKPAVPGPAHFDPSGTTLSGEKDPEDRNAYCSETYGSDKYTYRWQELALDPHTRQFLVRGIHVDLTPIEFGIIRALMRYPNKIFTREELLNIAYAGNTEISDRAIDTHIKNLRKKISIHASPGTYIKTVYGMGYRLSGNFRH